jgi:pimeloyl-ACP methyl ester carboxylesterase
VPGASKTLGEGKREIFRRCDREDLAHIDVPTLVIHGDADRIVPIAASGQRTAIKLSRVGVLLDALSFDIAVGQRDGHVKGFHAL